MTGVAARGPVFVTGGSGMLGRRVVRALVGRGSHVRALSRSDQSAAVIAEAGGEPIRGDLADITAIRQGLAGCAAVVHCAGRLDNGSRAEYVADNVTATNRLLEEARAGGIARFVHIGAAMSLLGGSRIDGADETWPLHEPKYAPYVSTKTLADRAVRDAATDDFATVVVRPAWVWGVPDDPHLQDVVSAVRAGRMRLIDHGRYPIVTSHIDNVVTAIVLALDHGSSGSAYFVFDDGEVTLKDFLSQLVRTQGLELPDASIPASVAWVVASAMEAMWKVLRRPGTPPINKMLVALNSGPFRVSDQLARRELGYRPVTSRADGLERLAR